MKNNRGTLSHRMMVASYLTLDREEQALLRETALSIRDAEDVISPPTYNQDSSLKYVILEGLTARNRFFTTNEPGKDQSLMADGTVGYKVLGYADSCKEAQIALYGYASATHND